MFPTTWYAPAMFSRTYFPRPSVRIHDAELVDFIPVSAEELLTVDGSGVTLVTGSARFMTVEAPASNGVSAGSFVLVESR